MESGPYILVGDRRVERATGVLADGTRLSARELGLLRALADAPGTVGREALSALLGVSAGSRALDMTMRRLREKLEADPARPVVLLTVYGEGYRLEQPRPAPVAAGTPGSPFVTGRIWVVAPVASGSSAFLEQHGTALAGHRRLDRPKEHVAGLGAPVVVVSGSPAPPGWEEVVLPTLDEEAAAARFRPATAADPGFRELVALAVGREALVGLLAEWEHLASVPDMARRLRAGELLQAGRGSALGPLVDRARALPHTTREAAAQLSVRHTPTPVDALDSLAVAELLALGWVTLHPGPAVALDPLARQIVVAITPREHLADARRAWAHRLRSAPLPVPVRDEHVLDALSMWDSTERDAALARHVVHAVLHAGSQTTLRRVLGEALELSLPPSERVAWLAELVAQDLTTEERTARARQALALARELGDLEAELTVVAAVAERDAGLDMEERLSRLDHAASRARQAGDRAALARVLVARARTETNAGAPERGVELAREALAAATRIDRPLLTVDILKTLGWLHIALGSTGEALHHLEEAEDLTASLGYSRTGASILALLGGALAGRDLALASSTLARARDAAGRTGNTALELHAQGYLAWIELARGDAMGARSLFRRTLRAARRAGIAWSQQDQAIGAAVAAWWVGDTAAADAGFEDAARMADPGDRATLDRIAVFRWVSQGARPPRPELPSQPAAFGAWIDARVAGLDAPTDGVNPVSMALIEGMLARR